MIKKKNAKSIPKLKKEALDLYAKIVKLRAYADGKLKCYTCDKELTLNTTDCQLGHYLSRGAYPGLTFHPDNSRVQDVRCNVWLHGNTVEFRHRLIQELGVERVEALEAMRHTPVKVSRQDYIEMIERLKAEIKEYGE
jgi:ribulose bisphosphate carboxylase small subunit